MAINTPPNISALEIDLTEYLLIAKEAVLSAGDFLSKRNQSSMKVNCDKDKDIKIAADLHSEEIILKHLTKNSQFSILSEERGFFKRENNDIVWIVDPLDGTMNYLRDVPICCVSIGLWVKNKPLVGVVYNFNTNELYSGIKGEGAWVGDGAIAVSDVCQKKDAILCTGLPVHTDFSQDVLQNFVTDIRRYKKIRMFGSAALSMCYVACGKTDVYYEKDIMYWDIAGGIPIILGAGGMVDYDNAVNKYSYNVYVSNGNLR